MTTSAMAADALTLLDELGIDSTHVYGISLGGMVAQELVLAAPDRVKALVLGATSAGGLEAYPRTVWAGLGAVSGGHHGMPIEFRSTSIRSVTTQLWACLTHDTSSRLGGVQAPTLIVHGARDRLLPLANGRALASLIPGAELRVIDGGGHLYAYNLPVQAGTIVLDWLATVGDVPAGDAPRRVPWGQLERSLGSPLRLARWQVSTAVQISRTITTLP